MTVKFSHERKVRSFAKKTLGSTRVGRAIRLPGAVWSRGWLDIVGSEEVRLFEEVGGKEVSEEKSKLN